MKLLSLLLSGLCISFVSVAQDQPKGFPKFKNNFGPERPLRVIVPKDSALLNIYPYANKKPGVYRLPKDGMPCIVPDTKDIAAIPNGWKGTLRVPYKGKKPVIPNPSKPDIQLDTK